MTSLVGPGGTAAVVCVRLGPGGRIGRHPAAASQLFAVVQGEGWVSGADGEQVPVAAGEAALWEPGEEHEAGTDVGMTAVVVEADQLEPPPA
ncbi:MAG: cupin domain-containing protein [Actinomycetota bacterium]|nr:cupin domain-containing protein [Actinomycetota bacterium]